MRKNTFNFLWLQNLTGCEKTFISHGRDGQLVNLFHIRGNYFRVVKSHVAFGQLKMKQIVFGSGIKLE